MNDRNKYELLIINLAMVPGRKNSISPPAASRKPLCAIPKQTSISLKISEKIYSLKFIKILNLLELLLYIYLLYYRIKVIKAILEIPKVIRSLIDLFDYENGWNFIFLLLLFGSVILTFSSRRRIAWILKLIGLICISVTLFLTRNYLGILTILLLFYYTRNKAILQFDILPKENIKFFIVTILTAIVLTFCSLTFYILNY